MVHGNLIQLVEVDSTSDYLRRRAHEDDLAPWTIVVADRQTAGHGQHGRSWASEGGGLYASFLLAPDVASPVFTLLAGVAALRACRRVSSAEGLGLKWVNDLVWSPQDGPGRKIGGLLAEVAHRRFVILGVGINLAPVSVPDAGSLEQAAGRPIDRWDLVEKIEEELRYQIARWRAQGAGPALAAWKADSVTLGRRVRVESQGRTLCGLAADLDAQGRLILELDDGRTEGLSSGTVRREDGSYA